MEIYKIPEIALLAGVAIGMVGFLLIIHLEDRARQRAIYPNRYRARRGGNRNRRRQ